MKGFRLLHLTSSFPRLILARCGGQGPLGRNEFDRGEVGAVTLDVAREQRAACGGGVRANEEVGQNVALATTGAPVLQKRLASEKKRGSRNLGQSQSHLVDDGVQRFDGLERQ